MSELTECCYCSLQEMRRRRKGTGVRVLLRRATWGYGGYEVYAVPDGEKLDKRSPDDGGKHWVAWFGDVSERCVC